MTEAMPEFIEPMLAKTAALPAEDSGWAFEVKWDGMRAIAACKPDSLTLSSRAGNVVTSAYPELAGLSAALDGHEAVLDGEIVAFDAQGRPSFQALQARIHLRGDAAVEQLARSSPVTYMIFDLLWLDGQPLTELPYAERRARLDSLALDSPRWQVPEFHQGDGAALLGVTRQHGLEGVIGKRLDSSYLPGKRAGWIKLKHSARQEVVIGGYTEGQGSRRESLGALHLGVHDEHGELRYVGRVGTGFDTSMRQRLLELMEPLARSSSPFTGRQPPRGAHFVEPVLVCEVEFSEWTHAGTLRQPSFKGLRDDKPAVQVVREPTSSEALPEPGPAPADDSRGAFDQLIDAGQQVSGGVQIEVGQRTLKLTNLEKVMYPQTGFTKRQLITYYAAVSEALLPHLKDRPLTLKRYPNGVDGKFFYEKRAPAHRPDWVRTVTVQSDRGKQEIPFVLCQDLATLIWLANLADIELHPSLSRARAIGRPTMIAFDLDPGAPADIVQCCEVALLLRELLDGIGLECFAKTSGSKGIQVYVPLNNPSATYEQTKGFARSLAQRLEQDRPDLVVSQMAKDKRTGRVLIDWSQNDVHKTTINVYSLRATERPSVSTPLDWDEVKACLDRADPALLQFGPDQVLARIAQNERFSAVLSLRQKTPKLKD